jgi:pilus assembly protein CpaE
MFMLRGAIICEEQSLLGRIESMIEEAGNVNIVNRLNHYPQPMEAARLIRLSRPEVVFLVVDSVPKTLEFVEELQVTASGTPVIAISRVSDPRALTELMRFGVREFLTLPLSRHRLHETIRRTMETSAARQSDTGAENLYCFLPARGGAGTSTLACNLSHALAQGSGKRILLADFDIASGLSRYLLKLNTDCSLGDLAGSGSYLDQLTWQKSIGHAGPLDVLNAGRSRAAFRPIEIRRILEFALPKYDLVCADLSGNMEMYSLELLRAAREIFLVSTIEAPSMDMAKEKIAFLTSLELGERVQVVLTVTPEGSPPQAAQAEKHLGAPIVSILDYSEKRVRKSLIEGSLIDRRSRLGRQIAHLAGRLSARRAA